MSLAHVKHGNQLPTIWEYFNSHQGKSIVIVRRQINARMKQWSHDRHIPIETSMYLKGTTIKALIKLKFNPGEGVAHLSSADKGLCIMCCLGCTSSETERIWECEDPLLAMENTWQLDKLLRMSKGVTRAPLGSHGQFLGAKNKHCHIHVSCVGANRFECDYYKGLHNIYGVLNLEEVMAQK
jgi:hypothetical protein